MNQASLARLRPHASAYALFGALLAALAGCSSDGAGEGTPAVSADFTVRSANPAPVLVEGDGEGLVLPLTLERTDGHDTPVTLSLEGEDRAAIAFVTHAFDTNTLGADDTDAQLTLRLDIADRSILPGSRRFVVVASDGTRTARTALEIEVQPIDAPDVYLLVGQSNMVGSSGDDTRRAGPGEPDESNPRVKQLNVTRNERFANAAAFRAPESNVSTADPIVVAEDALHEPLDPERESGKGSNYIGLGLTFGKRALADTSREVVLVPAAWSGSAFCDNDTGPFGQWNADVSDDPVLGNTLLFDRAVLRANIALEESGGILRGILWHQGESDANTPCATLYGENLQALAAGLRSRIRPDRRGSALRTADAPIPFVVGTMSRGVVDGDNDYSFERYNSAKRTIDAVHRDIASLVPYAAVSIHDDLVPANGYPCGTGDCIHFGAEALREMGVRYHDALARALADAPANP